MLRQIERQPIIILCAPRSFSSVICAMLGQHEELYGFPELNLFITDTLDSLMQVERSEQSFVGTQAGGYTSGLLRTIAQLVYGSQTASTIEESRQWLDARRSLKTREVFDFLLDSVQPRIGIDKSSRTAMSAASLGRAFNAYPKARFLHLTRHPVCAIKSLVKAHRQSEHTLKSKMSSVSQSALFDFYSALWCSTQRTILEFKKLLAVNRTLLVHAEDLLSSSDNSWRNLLVWLGVDSNSRVIESMRHPERSPYARAAPLGLVGDNDPQFLADPVLRLLSEWNSQPIVRAGIEPTPETNELVALLGY